MTPIELWRNIESHLDSSLDGWRGRIDAFGQVDAVEKRASGRTWSNNETFEALVLAVLSSNTDWSRIAGVQTELTEPFAGFSLEAYATLPPEEVTDRILPWFKARKAGSNTVGDKPRQANQVRPHLVRTQPDARYSGELLRIARASTGRRSLAGGAGAGVSR